MFNLHTSAESTSAKKTVWHQADGFKFTLNLKEDCGGLKADGKICITLESFDGLNIFLPYTLYMSGDGNSVWITPHKSSYMKGEETAYREDWSPDFETRFTKAGKEYRAYSDSFVNGFEEPIVREWLREVGIVVEA